MRGAYLDRVDARRPRIARRWARAAATVVIGLALVTGCTAATPDGAHAVRASSGAAFVGVTMFAVVRRQAAPDLVGKTLDGRRVSLDSLQVHRIVVLNVWASWCGPCRDESPMLAALAKHLQGSDVRFIGLNEHDATPQARAFAAATHASYPQLIDTEGSLLLKLKLLPQVAIPSTLVLDRHGRMAARVVGPATAPELNQILADLRKEA